MTDQIQKIVSDLPALNQVTGVWDVADRRLAAGDGGFVADLGLALVKASRSDADGRTWQYRSVLDHLVRLLALTPGAENVVHLLRLASALEVGRRGRVPYLASLLASGQRPADLAEVFRHRAPEELRACLVQELALRGVEAATVPAVARWAASPHWRHHPLAWLPLTLSEIERDPGLPAFGVRGGGSPMPYRPSNGSSGGGSSGRADRSARLRGVAETTSEPEATAMAAAFATWTGQSNGQVEARTFALGEPLQGDVQGRVLAGLGLECLHGGPKASSFSMSVQSPERAWEVLFAAASTGGAYDRGRYGAYGRLAAWQSLAGLAGAPAGAPHETVDERVRGCSWYDFEADTDWFHQVAWDVGIAALSPDRRRLAVLAATDTD
ncbi:DUF6183 family protein [Streptacidiphilus melanogenes]|uniref:DUF6183 family protein n=1 Tax=Streptacidiphilus melanogenes TaxID=411235 RepID=UPI0005AAD722|nr:DUF6183 family protein [Streptacidiphilus melanogenes]